MPSRRISKRASSRPAATSSSRIAPGGVPRSRRMPLSITSPDHRPGREAPRPGRRPPAARRAARARMRQRAARRARRLIGRLARVGQRHARPSRRAAGAARAPCARTELVLERLERRSRPARPPRRAVAAVDGDRAARRRPRQRRSAVADGPAMTTQAMRCSLAVSAAVRRAGAAPRRRRPSGERAERVERRDAPPCASAQALARDPWPACARHVVERRRHARRQLAHARRVLRAGSSRAAPSTSSASNTGRPVRHWNSTQPSENTSARGRDVALAAHLLGRHVAGRADRPTRCASACARRCVSRAMPKSSTLSRSIVAARQEQVLGLDVAVDDAARVRVAPAPRPRRAERDRLGDRDAACDRAASPGPRPRATPSRCSARPSRRRRGRRSGRSPGGQPGQDRRLLLEALAPRAPRGRSGS